ncbi:MAG: pilus assembly protein CpaE [Sphingomonas sp. 67-36]|nr:AAA family ATPase [Sphingomonas sp.]OJV30686.1 MAG: pilus assembly protein CpaE [Sphingomonas sp. 67-36]
MGNLSLPSKRFKEDVLRSNSRVTVVASPRRMMSLAVAVADRPLPDLKLEPLESGVRVPDGVLDECSLLIVEVDPDSAASMERLADIRSRLPDLPLVAAIDGASVSLVRALVKQGISDIVALPFDVEEIVQVTLDTAARRQAAPGQKVRLAPLISVARSIGGCGATTIATELAADLAAHDAGGRGAVIADLDLQYGSVTDFLGAAGRGDLADLLKAEDRLDEELIRSVIAQPRAGVSVVSAPAEIMPLESVDSDQLLKMIRLLRQEFGYVILDYPPDWTSWALSAALASDVILLVVELSVSSLRQARRRLDLFRSVGIESGSIAIVVNRAEKRLFKTIDLKDAADTLGHEILGSVSLEAPLVSTAQDQGQLVSDIRGKSKFCKDIANIGALLRERFQAKDG